MLSDESPDRRQECAFALRKRYAVTSRPQSTANFGNGQVAEDLGRESIRNLGVPRHSFDSTGIWIASERVRSTFALEITSMPTKLSEQDAALHPT